MVKLPKEQHEDQNEQWKGFQSSPFDQIHVYLYNIIFFSFCVMVVTFSSKLRIGYMLWSAVNLLKALKWTTGLLLKCSFEWPWPLFQLPSNPVTSPRKSFAWNVLTFLTFGLCLHSTKHNHLGNFLNITGAATYRNMPIWKIVSLKKGLPPFRMSQRNAAFSLRTPLYMMSLRIG